MHADHLHLTSIPLVAPGAALVVPRGAARLIRQECGADVADRCIEVAPGNQVRIGALDVTAVTAHHDGRRMPWSAFSGPALGYRVEGSPSVWFAGDTDLYDDLAAEAGPVDVAVVPVGGWGPSLGPGHLDPVRAAEAVRRVRARVAIPVHFGTFWPIGCDWLKPEMFLPPGDRFKTAMAEVDPAVTVEVLVPGESTEVMGT
jgi:L-ascorbate metabolism protein UlaG (beta-lactamase superfamily)